MPKLNLQEQKELLALARTTIESYLNDGSIPEFETDNPNLLGKVGVFVTLNKHSMLRGCIGNFSAKGPLYRNVQMMAVAAAVEDPRFRQVSPNELKDIEIEISVLSELVSVDSIDGICVGEHGLYVTKGLSRGVLLPQVATEYGWDTDTFLCETCVKAGMDRDEWRDGSVRIEKFTAQVFNEAGVSKGDTGSSSREK
ncbi:MAG: AmmeMemoRadiSam system protein A [Deltaproteobacteria bacterium]|nr:AmmeMemoRadiSam system protein A [Deltaproteobacteria bacterium]MCL5276783.1 AmmeMemoRadiSam system protein A [Deltaproteobacteria bacterium]